MIYRKLGGLQVSALGLGCMPMAGIGAAMYGRADHRESLATLERAIELGVTFFDTAEVYGPYVNEELLGQAIKGRRDRLVIATKFGFRIEDGEIRGVDSSPENIRRACEGSLKRLGIDTIDLYYQHRVDPNVPIEETIGAMSRLVEEGKLSLDDKASGPVDAALRRLGETDTLVGLFGPKAADITVKMLIQMRSGLADFDAPAFADPHPTVSLLRVEAAGGGGPVGGVGGSTAVAAAGGGRADLGDLRPARRAC